VGRRLRCDTGTARTQWRAFSPCCGCEDNGSGTRVEVSQAKAEAALCYDGAIITTLYAMAQKGTAYLLGAETHWLW